MKWLMYLASSLISQALYAQEIQTLAPSETNKKEAVQEEFEYN